MKIIVLPFVFCLLPFFEVVGQDMFKDTLQIEEVSIVQGRKKYFADGYQKNELSPAQLKQFNLRTLGEALQYSSGINVRSYGSPGASASVSFRGLGASQTQVNWNGFPINSITLGASDVSNIPIGMNQSFSLVPGASGVNYGSGTFGGALNIDFNSDDKSFDDVNAATLSYGSMNTMKGALTLNSKKEKLKSSTFIWGNKSDGDFEYYDGIKQEEFKRTNADYHEYGFQHYIAYKINNYSELQGGLWGQIKDLNLPAIEGGSLDNQENQKDSLFRAFIQWKRLFKQSCLHIKGAWFYADQHYIDIDDIGNYLIDSRIKSNVAYGDLNYRKYLNDHLSIDFCALYNYAKAKVGSYNGIKEEHNLAGTVGLKYVNGNLKLNSVVRKDWGQNFSSKVLFNIGTVYSLIPDKLFVRSAFSQKFRRPTFNDLYWEGSGNPDLTAEDGYSFELGSVYLWKTNIIGSVKIDASAYYSKVNNMIVWRPKGAVWYPENYEDVLTKGVDFKVSNHLKVSGFSFNTSLSLSYNKATIESIYEKSLEEEQTLYYSPKWISSINSNIGFKGFYLDVNWRFVSKRVYDGNGKTLDPYWLINGNIIKDISFNSVTSSLSFGVDNINNEEYQMVRSYPMPGRLWNIKLKVLF